MDIFAIFSCLSLSLCSLVDSLDFAPIDRLFEHDSGGLDGGEHLEHAEAHPEEDDHEDDAKEGVRVEPLANVRVRIENARRFRAVRKEKGHHEGS